MYIEIKHHQLAIKPFDNATWNFHNLNCFGTSSKYKSIDYIARFQHCKRSNWWVQRWPNKGTSGWAWVQLVPNPTQAGLGTWLGSGRVGYGPGWDSVCLPYDFDRVSTASESDASKSVDGATALEILQDATRCSDTSGEPPPQLPNSRKKQTSRTIASTVRTVGKTLFGLKIKQ